MIYDFKNEDALVYVRSLPSASIDLVLTDPPYAISRETNFQSGAEKGTDVDRFRVSYDFGKWDVVDEDYFKVLFNEVYRTMKDILRLKDKIKCLYENIEDLEFAMLDILTQDEFKFSKEDLGL